MLLSEPRWRARLAPANTLCVEAVEFISPNCRLHALIGPPVPPRACDVHSLCELSSPGSRLKIMLRLECP